MAFWVAGLIGAVWCVWFFVWFRDDPARKPGVNAAAAYRLHSFFG